MAVLTGTIHNAVHPSIQAPLLIALAGPTASGKSALALALAEALDGEIISCDSIAVYRGMDIGSAKPTPAERARIRHHCIDIYDPDKACTAGDYARHARASIADIHARRKLPVIAGGTGLYMRAVLDGLAPAPQRNEPLRDRLRTRSPAHLHRVLQRLDPRAATLIHPNDQPKLIRSIEVTLAARTPQTAQWQSGRDALQGFRVLRLALAPPRAALYDRINARCAAMFANGLIPETAALVARYGADCPPLAALGYLQAQQVLRHERSQPEAIAAAQQGHRNYAKRQLTWFRRESGTVWLAGFGDDARIHANALALIARA